MRIPRLVAAASIAAAIASSQAFAATKVNVLYTAVSANIAAYVAKDQGYFDKHGLDLDLTLVNNGSVIVAALTSNSAQIGLPTPTVLLPAVDAGIDLVIINGTDLYPTSTASGVVARAGSNIAGPKDLAGKKVGVPGLSGIIDVLTRKWVQTNGLDWRRVSWIEVGFPVMGEALKSGSADAVATVDPFYTRIVDGGLGTRIGDYGSVVPDGTSPVNFVSLRKWATENPNAVKAFRAGMDDGVAFVKDPANKAAVLDSLVKYTKLPPQVAATITLPKNLTNKVTPSQISYWIDLSVEQGIIKKKIDPASLIAP